MSASFLYPRYRPTWNIDTVIAEGSWGNNGSSPGGSDDLDRVLGSDAASGSATCSSDTLVKTGPGLYRGLSVTAALNGQVLQIRDATSAGTGTVIHTIAASSGVGMYSLPMSIPFTLGLYVDFHASGTGTVVVPYV